MDLYPMIMLPYTPEVVEAVESVEVEAVEVEAAAVVEVYKL
jgi:hypothetical protein